MLRKCSNQNQGIHTLNSNEYFVMISIKQCDLLSRKVNSCIIVGCFFLLLTNYAPSGQEWVLEVYLSQKTILNECSLHKLKKKILKTRGLDVYQLYQISSRVSSMSYFPWSLVHHNYKYSLLHNTIWKH